MYIVATTENAGEHLVNKLPKTIFFTFLFVFCIIRAEATEKCRKYIQPNSCEYYLCEEKAHDFGKEGYFLGFGYKYCQTFFTTISQRLTPAGSNWLTRVGACLQNKLIDSLGANDEYFSNELVEDIAVSSHSNCYLETRGCDLAFPDLIKVVGTLSKELYRPSIAQEGIQFLMGCTTSNPLSL